MSGKVREMLEALSELVESGDAGVQAALRKVLAQRDDPRAWEDLIVKAKRAGLMVTFETPSNTHRKVLRQVVDTPGQPGGFFLRMTLVPIPGLPEKALASGMVNADRIQKIELVPVPANAGRGWVE